MKLFIYHILYNIFITHFYSVYQRLHYVSSSIKLKVRLPVVDDESCRKAYRLHNLKLGPGQVCAGGVRGRDSCLGDSGGPLMYIDSEKIACVLSGIVSFGSEQCGAPGVPGVYTKVEHYMDWIIENLEK